MDQQPPAVAVEKELTPKKYEALAADVTERLKIFKMKPEQKVGLVTSDLLLPLIADGATTSRGEPIDSVEMFLRLEKVMSGYGDDPEQHAGALAHLPQSEGIRSALGAALADTEVAPHLRAAMGKLRKQYDTFGPVLFEPVDPHGDTLPEPIPGLENPHRGEGEHDYVRAGAVEDLGEIAVKAVVAPSELRLREPSGYEDVTGHIAPASAGETSEILGVRRGMSPGEMQELLARKDAERLMPQADIGEIQREMTDMLAQFGTFAQYSAAEVGAHEQALRSGVVDRLSSKIDALEQGYSTLSEEAFMYKLGVYLTTADNPRVVDALMDQAKRVMKDADLAKIEERIARIARQASADPSQEEANYHGVASLLHSYAGHMGGASGMSVVDFAIRGATIGAYTHLKEDALHHAVRQLGNDMEYFYKTTKG